MKTLLALLFLAASSSAQGSAYTYCQTNPNSFGSHTNIQFAGSLDLSHGTFKLIVTGHPPTPGSWGMFTYGLNQYNVPFGNGYLCIMPFNPGIQRMTPQMLGPGALVHDMAQYPNDFANLTPGSSWNFQFWHRDPQAGGSNFNLSDALHVTFAP
jgi:hypothetical protein